MSLVANGVQLRKILYVDSQYIIPRNQRKYVWTISEIESLYEDIIFNIRKSSAGEDYQHFIGSFIFQKEKENSIVVDGQQRLTTLTILLAVVVKFLRHMGKTTLADTIISYIASKDEELTGIYNLRILNSDYSVYSMIIYDFCIKDCTCLDIKEYFEVKKKKISNSEQFFVNCCDYFIREIGASVDKLLNIEEKADWLKSLKETVINLDAVQIDSTNEQEGYIVFETLNARGLPLEQSELIKNYIFMYSQASVGSDLTKEKWLEIVNNVEDIKYSTMNQFISHYITHAYGKVPSKDEYKQVKKHVKKNEVDKFLDDLVDKSIIYKEICLPDISDYSSTVKYVLNFCNSFSNKQFRPIFLSLLEAYKKGNLSEKELEKCMVKIKNFLSIYFVVCKWKANSLEEHVYEYAVLLHNDYTKENFSAFLKNIASKLPPKDTFIQQFKELSYTNHKDKYPKLMEDSKRRCQHVMREFEINAAEIDDYILTSFTIEHIKADSKGGNACFIGNMLPLVKKGNVRLEDKPFAEKLPTYASSCFVSTTNFYNRYKEVAWDDETILKRSEYMGREFYENIWKVL